MSTKNKLAASVAVVGLVLALGSGRGCTLPIPLPVEPAPIPAPGLNVLVVEETADRGNLPLGKLNVLNSVKVREAVQAAGGNMLILDDDVDLANLPEAWRVGMQLPRTELPWLVISTDGKNYQGPLPESVDAMLAKLGEFNVPQ